MKLARLTLSIVSSLVLVAPLAQAQDGLMAKQLAGPPSEFAEMRAPSPGADAILSKSALIPVEFGAEKSGGKSWQGELPVENGKLRFLVFSGQQSNWQVDLATPSGRQQQSARSMAKDFHRTDFGMEESKIPGDFYELEGIESGAWKLKVSAAAGATGGYVLMEGDDATQLASYQTHRRQLVGERIGLATTLNSDEGATADGMSKSAARIERAALRVTAPDGTISNYSMFDDGKHGDGAARDGVFGGDFPAITAGQYLAQVVVHGRNGAGQKLIRTAEHLIPIVETSLQLTAGNSALTSQASSETRFSIDLPVSTTSKSAQHYRALAEVWGSNASGQSVPVAWIGGMVSPGSGALNLGLDQRWVARSGAMAPFELRNVRIEDADYFVTVAKADRLSLNLPAVSAKAARDSAIDESMTMGERPAELKSVAKGVGTKLLLVHGYCSGGVWPAAQFSNAATFLDANQNRTHDQFANLIKTFGNTWNSYGIVAHSQGGAASLHLYTYYWSGLDNATGSRLIQSVGTPYQGTNLSGILATLGSWFGVGCSTNANMTYSGSAAWLAGIPTWARAKVNFYTTSFKLTNWYTNDYCNFATDLVLSDPEDGTTEQAYGQLPGGVNRGHTTGECHTSGMRDPAQYNDASRNSIMNTNAAR